MRFIRSHFDIPCLNGHAEVEAELEKELEEDVLLATVGLEVQDGGVEGCGEIRAVRFPRSNVTAGELEHAEAEVAREQRVLLPNLLPNATQPFFGQLGDGARFLQIVTQLRGKPLLVLVGIKSLGQLNK